MKERSQSHRILNALLLLFAIYQLLRLGFVIKNPELMDRASWQELCSAWLFGWRFDIAALAMINGPIFLLFAFPLSRKLGAISRWKPIASQILFVFLNGYFISSNIGDMEYFQFSARRLTLSTFHIQKDIWEQAPSIALYHWPLSLMMLASFTFMIPLARYTFVRSPRREPRTCLGKTAQDLALCLLIILFSVLAGRGGWQKKPLIAAHAYLGPSAELAQLSLNSSFTFIKSINQKTFNPLDYYPDWDTLRSALSKPLPSKGFAGSQKTFKPELSLAKDNIVVIVLESFGLEYMEQGYTPFLSSLAEKGRFFSRNLANGRRSIDAIPAIFASVPAWMNHSFITSDFQTNRIDGLAQRFRKKGYRSKFFHGGLPGTMFFDIIARKVGFESYVDASDYPQQKDFDGQWGIFDEPFLQFVANNLDSPQINSKEKNSTPFIAGIFTLSSHHPYTIPEQHQNQFPKGTLEIHESIAYADYSLQQFFETAKTKTWYKNTLFVITADHTSKAELPSFRSELGRYRVPLIFYHPSKSLHALSDTTKTSQHLDIKPTILDLFGLPFQDALGQSLCRTNASLAIVYNGSTFIGASDQFHLQFQPPNQWEFFDRNDFIMRDALNQSQLNPEEIEWHQAVTKARIQAFRNGLIEDKLVW